VPECATSDLGAYQLKGKKKRLKKGSLSASGTHYDTTHTSLISQKEDKEARVRKTPPATDYYFTITDYYYIPAWSLLCSLLQGAGVWVAELSTPVPWSCGTNGGGGCCELLVGVSTATEVGLNSPLIIPTVSSIIIRAGCWSGRNADPRLGFNWNVTHGFKGQ